MVCFHHGAAAALAALAWDIQTVAGGVDVLRSGGVLRVDCDSESETWFNVDRRFNRRSNIYVDRATFANGHYTRADLCLSTETPQHLHGTSVV